MPPTPSNRYELLDKIAKGGMAEVYRARRLGTRDYNSLVAVKRILPERAEDTNFVEMLIDEARITSQLRHPNIAQLYELACDESGYFIVMELLLGPNFAALIDKLKVQGRHLPQACAVEVAIQMLKALDYAHNKRDANGRPLNLVHRDISPDNLLLGPNGEVKLIDFGVAKAKDRLADKTKAGMIKGKFSYLAPERLRSSASDPRSDLFSAALVLWEALAGRIRFDAEDDRELIEQIEENRSPSFREMDIEIAPQLETILDRALRTRPDERYQSAAEFLNVLERYQRRFNPGDNVARLGKLVSSSFKEELRWLEDARRKFESGRLHPLGIVGGGIIEERFQLSKRLTSTQKPTQHQLKVPSARRSAPALLDTQRRIETNIFADHGIELLEGDFEEFDRLAVRPSEPSLPALPLAAPDNIPKTELSPPPAPEPARVRRPASPIPAPRPEFHEDIHDELHDETHPEGRRPKKAPHQQPLCVPASEQKTRTRVFDFGGSPDGHGRRLDIRLLVILAGAIVGGFLLFTLLLGGKGEVPTLPTPPTLPTATTPPPPAPATPTPVATQPAPPASPASPATAAQPAPATPPPPVAAQPDAAPPPAMPAPTASPATAAPSAEERPKPAKKKKTKKRKAKKRAAKKKKTTRKKAAPRPAPVQAAEDDDFFESDDLSDDEFFESDDLTEDDDSFDDAEDDEPQSAHSAADEAFEDF